MTLSAEEGAKRLYELLHGGDAGKPAAHRRIRAWKDEPRDAGPAEVPEVTGVAAAETQLKKESTMAERECKECHKIKKIHGKGLCSTCFFRQPEEKEKSKARARLNAKRKQEAKQAAGQCGPLISEVPGPENWKERLNVYDKILLKFYAPSAYQVFRVSVSPIDKREFNELSPVEQVAWISVVDEVLALKKADEELSRRQLIVRGESS
jgi:hypothetical protein